MFGEALALIHLLLVEMKHVLEDLLHLHCPFLPWWFGTVIVFVIGCLRLVALSQYDEPVLVEVSLLEFGCSTLVLALLAGKLVAVPDHAVVLQ